MKKLTPGKKQRLFVGPVIGLKPKETYSLYPYTDIVWRRLMSSHLRIKVSNKCDKVGRDVKSGLCTHCMCLRVVQTWKIFRLRRTWDLRPPPLLPPLLFLAEKMVRGYVLKELSHLWFHALSEEASERTRTHKEKSASSLIRWCQPCFVPLLNL